MTARANWMRSVTIVLLAVLLTSGNGYSLGPDVLAFLASEQQSGDLNGDGDDADWVVHVLDGKTGAAVNLRLAAAVVCRSTLTPPFTACGAVEPTAGKTAIAFVVGEGAQGADLNGDDDVNDGVLYVYEEKSGVVVPTRLAVALAVGRDVSSFTFPVPPVVADKLVVVLAGEPENGHVDLNGDGDAFDAVVEAVDLKSLQLINIGLAAATIVGPFGARNPMPPELNGNTVTVAVGEAEQGGRDLNGDGDADDQIRVALHGQIDRFTPEQP